MKEKITTKLLLLALFPLWGLGGFAQTYDWQWAYRGGGTQSSTASTTWSPSLEQIFDVQIDQNNNYYFAGTVVNYNPQFMGQSITKYGTNASDNDIYIVSLDCEGNYRWHTVIGGDSPGENEASITLDGLGGLYISFRTQNLSRSNNDAVPPHYAQGVFLGPGVSGANPNPNNRRIVLIKYDTDGNYQWHRMPQDENVTYTYVEGYFRGGGAAHTVIAEPDGTLHWLCGFFPGNHLGGQLVITEEDMPDLPTGGTGAVYTILKYDKDGNYLSHVITPLNRGGGEEYYQNAL